MKTFIKKELEKSIISNDILGFKDELVKKTGAKIMSLSLDELLPVFYKAAENCEVDWENHTETIYDDGLDYTSHTRSLKSKIIDYYSDEIINFIKKRRCAARYDLKKDIKIFRLESMPSQPVNAKIENISSSGLLMLCAAKLNKGEKLELLLNTNGNKDRIKFLGSVVRSENDFDEFYKTGIKISSILHNNKKEIFLPIDLIYS